MTHKEALQLLLVSLFYTVFLSAGLLIIYEALCLMFWGPKVIFSEFMVLWALCTWLTENPNSSWKDAPRVRVLTEKGTDEED